MKKKIYAICGPGGAGKSTILQELKNLDIMMCQTIESNINFITQVTTRPRRLNESENDYKWLGKYSFAQKVFANELLIANSYGPDDWMYGVLREDIKEDKINIGIFSIEDVEDLQDFESTEIEIIPIFLDIKLTTRLQRMINRQENEIFEAIDEITRRFKDEAIKYSIENYKMTFDHFIICNNEDQTPAETALFIYNEITNLPVLFYQNEIEKSKKLISY